MKAEEAKKYLEDKVSNADLTSSYVGVNWRDVYKTAVDALDKRIPKIRYNPDDEQNGHFYLVNGYMTCRETGKDIRYPLSSFGDLDFCPRCGQALIWREVEK